jgi:uncharacterized protein YjbI with pentapeptide repeats
MTQHATEHFKPSFAELLHYFGGRAAERGSPRTRARGEERRAALRAYAFAHTRRLLVWVIASACVVWIVVLIDVPDVSTASVAQVPVEPVPIAPAQAALSQAALSQAALSQAALSQAALSQAALSQAAPVQTVPAPVVPAAVAEASLAPAPVGQALVQKGPAAVANSSALSLSPPPQVTEAEASAAAQEAAKRQAAEEKTNAEAARASAPPPAPFAETASAAPVEQPAPSAPLDAAMEADAALSDQKTLAEPTIEQATLRSAEMREVQALLEGFGFDPGPIDGTAGAKTQAAAMRYRLSRGGADTGPIDRQLLEALRRDPVPPLPPWPVKVAQRQKTPPSVSPSNPQAAQGQKPPPSASPLNPVLASIKTVSERLSQWLNSIGR